MQTTSGRLLSLLSLLQSRRDWPGTLLAERLDVSPRTVRRDVDRLRELGYPVHAVKGPDGGYRLDAGTELPPLLFDDEQAVALAVALQIAITADAGIEEAAARALTTVRQVMPARLRRRIDTVRFTAVRRPTARPEPRIDPAVLTAVTGAIHAGEVLRFDYSSARPRTDGEPVPPRRVEPHHVVTWGGRWYLVGWDQDRSDWRTFRLDRITLKSPNGPRFTRRELPGGDVATYIAEQFQGGTDGTGQWPCQGEVILRKPAEVLARYTADGLVEDVGPDRARLVLGSWSWRALAAAIARFDADIEVIDPPELRHAFAELATRFTTAAT